MDPNSGFGTHGFVDLPKSKVGDGRDWQRGWCLSAAVCHLGCSALLLHSGPSRSATLGRAVASSSHCQLIGPKELQARSRPIANPPKVNSSQERAHPNTIKKRSNTIKNDQISAFPYPGPIAGPSPATKLLPEDDQSHGCRSTFSVSCGFEHGREDCRVRVHTCSPVKELGAELHSSCMSNSAHLFGDEYVDAWSEIGDERDEPPAQEGGLTEANRKNKFVSK